MPRTLLVPLDGSPQSKAALEYAVETVPESEIVVIYVLNPAVAATGVDGTIPDSAFDEQRQFAEELFADARDIADEDRIVETELLAGRAATEIVEYATKNGIDEIVMGSHGRDGAARLLLGSVSETVVRRSPVPVTVVR